MRASVDPLRDQAVGLIEVAKSHADDAVKAGEHRVRGVIDTGADLAASRVDRLVAHAPTITVSPSAATHSNRRRWLLVAILVGVAMGLWAWRRKGAASASSASPAEQSSTEGSDDGASYRVVPKPEGGWELQAPGRADTEHRTQATAIEQGKALAQAAGGGQIVVHGLDGEPRDTVTV